MSEDTENTNQITDQNVNKVDQYLIVTVNTENTDFSNQNQLSSNVDINKLISLCTELVKQNSQNNVAGPSSTTIRTSKTSKRFENFNSSTNAKRDFHTPIL